MPILTQEEAAAKLRVPVIRLKNWRWTGTGPCYMRPTRQTVLYDSEVLDAWLASSIRVPSVQAFMEERNVRTHQKR